MIRMVIAAVSVLFICVFVALLVKCFAIDLALLLRPYLPLRSHREGKALKIIFFNIFFIICLIILSL